MWCARVAADHSQAFQFGAELVEHARHALIEAVAVAIDDEEVCAQLLAGGARLDPGEVDAGVGEALQGLQQRTGAIGGGEDDRGLVVAGGLVITVREDDEPSGVAMVVFDPGFGDLSAVDFGGPSRRDRGNAPASWLDPAGS